MSTLLLMLLGCYPEISEVERRQDALASEVETLEAEVEQLEAALRAAGVKLGGGPAQRARTPRPRRARKGPRPERTDGDDVTAALGLTLERTGQPGPITVTEIVKTGKPCGHKALVPSLKRISDFQLSQRGLGKASPLRVRVGGTELAAHAFPRQYESCGGAFRHAGTVVLFSTPTPDSPAEPQVFFDPRFPSQNAGGAPAHWVHPGQIATMATKQPWDRAWGEPRLLVESDAARPPVITVDGEPAAPGPLAGEGPWTVTIEAQDHTLLKQVQIRSDSHVADALQASP